MDIVDIQYIIMVYIVIHGISIHMYTTHTIYNTCIIYDSMSIQWKHNAAIKNYSTKEQLLAVKGVHDILLTEDKLEKNHEEQN